MMLYFNFREAWLYGIRYSGQAVAPAALTLLAKVFRGCVEMEAITVKLIAQRHMVRGRHQTSTASMEKVKAAIGLLWMHNVFSGAKLYESY